MGEAGESGGCTYVHAPVHVLQQVLGTLRQVLERRIPSLSDEAGDAGGGLMTLARGQLS